MAESDPTPALKDPSVSLCIESAELDLKCAVNVVIGVPESRSFQGLATMLATAMSSRAALDLSLNEDVAQFNQQLQTKVHQQEERHLFYNKIRQQFDRMTGTIQTLKRDYYREIDHLREQISRLRKDPNAEVDNVFFFDPDHYRLPSWEDILAQLDDRRMKREVLKEQQGPNIMQVPVHMLCQACRNRFLDGVDPTCSQATQTEVSVGNCCQMAVQTDCEVAPDEDGSAEGEAEAKRLDVADWLAKASARTKRMVRAQRAFDGFKRNALMKKCKRAAAKLLERQAAAYQMHLQRIAFGRLRENIQRYRAAVPPSPVSHGGNDRRELGSGGAAKPWGFRGHSKEAAGFARQDLGRPLTAEDINHSLPRAAGSNSTRNCGGGDRDGLEKARPSPALEAAPQRSISRVRSADENADDSTSDSIEERRKTALERLAEIFDRRRRKQIEEESERERPKPVAGSKSEKQRVLARVLQRRLEARAVHLQRFALGRLRANAQLEEDVRQRVSQDVRSLHTTSKVVGSGEMAGQDSWGTGDADVTKVDSKSGFNAAASSQSSHWTATSSGGVASDVKRSTGYQMQHRTSNGWPAAGNQLLAPSRNDVDAWSTNLRSSSVVPFKAPRVAQDKSSVPSRQRRFSEPAANLVAGPSTEDTQDHSVQQQSRAHRMPSYSPARVKTPAAAEQEPPRIMKCVDMMSTFNSPPKPRQDEHLPSILSPSLNALPAHKRQTATHRLRNQTVLR